MLPGLCAFLISRFVYPTNVLFIIRCCRISKFHKHLFHSDHFHLYNYMWPACKSAITLFFFHAICIMSVCKLFILLGFLLVCAWVNGNMRIIFFLSRGNTVTSSDNHEMGTIKHGHVLDFSSICQIICVFVLPLHFTYVKQMALTKHAGVQMQLEIHWFDFSCPLSLCCNLNKITPVMAYCHVNAQTGLFWTKCLCFGFCKSYSSLK